MWTRVEWAQQVARRLGGHQDARSIARADPFDLVVTVHLLFDAVVFGVLVHAHNPGLVPLFLV